MAVTRQRKKRKQATARPKSAGPSRSVTGARPTARSSADAATNVVELTKGTDTIKLVTVIGSGVVTLSHQGLSISMPLESGRQLIRDKMADGWRLV